MGKDVVIRATVAEITARAPQENIMHHCPMCKQVFNWQEFVNHAEDCIKTHGKGG